jgi:peptidyl-prolyl cis-trans isomerase SurA
MRSYSQRLRRIASVLIAAGVALPYRPGLVAALLLAVLTGGLVAVGAQEVSIKILVNDDPISDYDIDQRERFLAITTQQQPSPALKKQAADMLIDERLQLQEGRKATITPNDEDVTLILTDMAQKNNLDVDGLATALAKAGVNIKTLKDRIRAQVVWQEAVRRKFRRDVQIGDADVEKAMAEASAASGAPAASGAAAEGGVAAEGGAAEPALQLRQVKFEIPAGADQKTIAARLAAAESLRARFASCAELAKGVDGARVQTLQDQKPASLAQPVRLLVTHAKVGQMTPPTISQAAVELYAVCGKRSFTGDTAAREQTQRQLMNQEMGLRAERLLRDIRQEAFIEYR